MFIKVRVFVFNAGRKVINILYNKDIKYFSEFGTVSALVKEKVKIFLIT